MKFDSIEAVTAAFQAGEFVIVSDSADREDEADLIIAAERLTVDAMALLIRYTSGIICVPMLADRAEQFGLERLTSNTPGKFDTPFAMPVDYSPACVGGVSAAERTATVQALLDVETNPADFGRPGHVFPLIAQPGGVRDRPGHTEAGIELTRLAGLQPLAVIGELMNPDGTMMRGQDLIDFAEDHQLCRTSVEALIEYRTTNPWTDSVSKLLAATPTS